MGVMLGEQKLRAVGRGRVWDWLDWEVGGEAVTGSECEPVRQMGERDWGASWQ